MVRPDRVELPTFWFVVRGLRVHRRPPRSIISNLTVAIRPYHATLLRCFRAGSCQGSSTLCSSDTLWCAVGGEHGRPDQMDPTQSSTTDRKSTRLNSSHLGI